MALRQLMLGKKIEQKQAELAEVRKNLEGFTAREAELEAAIDEAKTEEEEKAVDEEIEKFTAEKQEGESKQKELEEELSALEKELEGENKKAAPPEQPPVSAENEERKRGSEGMKRVSCVVGAEERMQNLLRNENVKGFLERVRSFKGETRAVTGAELTIPDEMLGMLRDNLNRYSKLLPYVAVRSVGGKARQNILGIIPEAVWTEMVATINELSFTINQVEVDGYKVAGFMALPNSTLEDSDLNLASEIMDMLGQAIGLALDKAIVYGKGTKMPHGFVTRLTQETKPTDWSDNAPEWTDLHTTNIIKKDYGSLSGAKFFSTLILDLGIAKSKYSDGKKAWAMNSTTKNIIMSNAVTFNSGGALVASMNDEMPIIGGKIIELDFMADGDIAGGYLSLYLLAERKGGTFAVSEHIRFLEDQTVFKGTARYDGKPVMGSAFVIININNVSPQVTATFVEDKANVAPTT